VKKKKDNLILGAGITGLAAGISTGWPVYEATARPGGICSSYNIGGYRFERGGGHWIFGADNTVLSFIRKFTDIKNYKRRSAVCLNKDLYVPYPIQNNLRFLGQNTAEKALKEILAHSNSSSSTMKEWLKENFGPTLCKLFFYPFHDLYTSKLYERIAPQEAYKSPVNIKLVKQGAKSHTPAIGYNANFVYPEEGLNSFAQGMTEKRNVHYGKRAVKIDVEGKKVYFADNSTATYDKLISTLPLNKMIEMSGFDIGLKPDPYTSVLVLNVGAIRGDKCPDEHWLYIPASKSGFHRVGFYSNVDKSFLPRTSQKINNLVSIYIERSYPGGQKPSHQKIEDYANSVIGELKDWGFIKDIEVLDPTWIDVAYTYSWPGSSWRTKAIMALKIHDIHQFGRYGRWHFQGIAESIKSGLLLYEKVGKRVTPNYSLLI